MKVAIDSGSLTSGHAVRGVGSYTRNLLASIAVSGEKQHVKIDSFDFTKNEGKLKHYDLIHYPFFDLFFDTLPSVKPTKTIITIHDVIPLLYPKHYPPGLKGTLRFLKQKKSLKSVSAVITDTEASKKDIVRFLDVPEKKITSIHLAAGGKFKKLGTGLWCTLIREKFNLPEHFVLYVGDVNYNKNIPNLVKACDKANVPLVLVGKHAQDIENLEYALRSMKGPKDWIRFLVGKTHPELAHQRDLLTLVKNNPNVLRLGYVDEEDLVALFNIADIYCQPSLYEGFGIPPLEAQVCGCPVVSSRTQALVEILNKSALFVDPLDISQMAEGIKKMVSDKKLREKYIKKGFENVKQYSWKKTAQQTLEVYKQIV